MEILLIIMFAPLALALGFGLIAAIGPLLAPLEILGDAIEGLAMHYSKEFWTNFWWGTAGILASLMLLVRIFG